MNKYIPALAVMMVSVVAAAMWWSEPWQMVKTTYEIKSTKTMCDVENTTRLVGLLIDDEQAVLRTHWFDTNVLKIYTASYELGCDLTSVNDWYCYSPSGTAVNVSLPPVMVLNASGIDASMTVDVYGNATDAQELGSMLREAEKKMRERAVSGDNIDAARRNVERLTRSLFWQLPADSVVICWR